MLKKLLYTILAIVLLLVILTATQIKRDIPLEDLKKKYTNAQSKYIEVDGIQVHYRMEGQGPALVLLHGTSSSLHTWDEWTRQLQDSFTVIRLDYPGFGITGPCSGCDYSIDYYTGFLEEFFKKTGVTRFSLAGNSLGGLIAWQYALKHPEQVEKLILIDAAGFKLDKVPFAFKMARTPIINNIARYATPYYLFTKSIKEVYGDDSKVTDELVQRYYELTLRAGNRDAFIKRANGDYNFDTGALKDLKMPVLIQWGEADIWIPLKHAEQFHAAIPGSQLITYPGVGHVPMEEIGAQTAADAAAFLR